MSAAQHNGPDCITERHTEHGYWWRYQHSDDEPLATLEAAIMVAGDVAAEEAGKTYLVARAACGVDAIYVFACDHPDALSADVNIMFDFPRRPTHPPPRAAQRSAAQPALTHRQPLQGV